VEARRALVDVVDPEDLLLALAVPDPLARLEVALGEPGVEGRKALRRVFDHHLQLPARLDEQGTILLTHVHSRGHCSDEMFTKHIVFSQSPAGN